MSPPKLNQKNILESLHRTSIDLEKQNLELRDLCLKLVLMQTEEKKVQDQTPSVEVEPGESKDGLVSLDATGKKKCGLCVLL